MKFTFLKGTPFPFGSKTVELLSDTELEVVGVDDLDHLAEVMASADQKTFGQHVASMAHDEVAIRDLDGVDHEFDIAVTYGAGGARIDTAKDAKPRPVVKVVAPTTPVVPEPVPEPPDALTPSFPGFIELEAAGITKRSELKGKSVEELEKIKGIEATTAQRIYAELTPPLTDDEIKARDEADAKTHAEALETEKQAETDRQKSLSAA